MRLSTPSLYKEGSNHVFIVTVVVVIICVVVVAVIIVVEIIPPSLTGMHLTTGWLLCQ
jgi:hypothetical protein